MMQRDIIQKFVFIVAIIAAAFVVRGAHYGVSQSADIATVTVSTPSTGSGQAGATTSGDAPPSVGMAGFSFGATVADAGGAVASASDSSTTSTASESPDNGLAPFVRVGTDPAPALDYHEALIADLQSGVVLFGDHNTDRWPIASISKLMTATIVVDDLSMNQVVTVTPEDFAVDPTEPTLAVGDTYTVADLLHVMLLRSSNVAAETLADFYGHGRFLDAMNVRAQELGMRSTYYTTLPAFRPPMNQRQATLRSWRGTSIRIIPRPLPSRGSHRRP